MRRLLLFPVLILLITASASTVFAVSPPNAPSGLAATPFMPVTTVNLSWTDNSGDEDNFLVERSQDGGASWSTIDDTLPPGTTTYSDTTPVCSASYLYRVSAVNANGSSPSNIVAVMTHCAGNYNDSLYVQPATTINVPHNYMDAVALGDLNGDGRRDVVALSDNTVSVFAQQSGHTLSAAAEYTGVYAPPSIAAGDLNHDGLADLAFSHSNNVAVMMQNGAGTLAPFVDKPFMSSGTVIGIAIGDVTGDGLPDLVGTIVNGIAVMPQQPGGSLGSRADYGGSTGDLSDIAIGDVNGDGRADVVGIIYSGSPHNVEVYLQNSGGTLDTPPVSYPVTDPSTTVSGSGGVAIGDVTGDGLNDVVVDYGGNRPDSRIGIFPQKTDHTLDTMRYFYAYDIPTPIALADADQDGHLDVFTANAGTASVSVHFTDAAAGYPLRFGRFPGYTQGDWRSMAVGDINGDCTPDIVTEDAINSVHVTYHAAGSGPCPALDVSPHKPPAFADQNVGSTGSPQTITLSSTGSSDLHVSAISAGPDFALQPGGTCAAAPFSLSTGATCTIQVAFNPTATGARTGVVTIDSDAWDSPRLVALSGTGTAPLIQLTPTAHDFGSLLVGQVSAPFTVTVTNAGTGELTVSSLDPSGAFAAINNTCTAPVAVSGTCTFDVTFNPVAPGPQTGGITIRSNQPGAPPSLTLTGTGLNLLPAPVLKSPKNGSTVTRLPVKFTWKSVRGAKGYHIRISQDSTFQTGVIQGDPTRASFSASLPAFGVYYWEVASKDAAGTVGGYSAPFSFTYTLNKSPKNGSLSKSTTPKFAWQAVRGATYLLEFSTAPGFPAGPGTVRITTTKAGYPVPKTTPLSHGQIYYWHLSTDGGSTWTLPWSFKVP